MYRARQGRPPRPRHSPRNRRDQRLGRRHRLPHHPRRLRPSPSSPWSLTKQAAVGLAARMWSSAALGASATRALRKLEAAGVDITPLPEGAATARRRRGIRSAGRRRGGARVVVGSPLTIAGSSDTEPAERRVEPWGVVSVARPVGISRVTTLDRAAPRVFRLSRVLGEPRAEGEPGAVTVPRDIDLSAPGVGEVTRLVRDQLARVKVRHDRAIGLRRQDHRYRGRRRRLGRRDRAVPRPATARRPGAWLLAPTRSSCPRPRRARAVVRRYADPCRRCGHERRHRPSAAPAGDGCRGCSRIPAPAVADVARGVRRHRGAACAVTSTCCGCAGLPGYGPGDLIDITWHGDRVTLSNADEIAETAASLTPEEALALIAALRVLSGVPGID